MHRLTAAGIIVFTGVVALFAALVVHRSSGNALKQQLVGNYEQVPLSFEANVGQAGRDVAFISRGSGYSLFLKRDHADLVVRHEPSSIRLRPIGGNPKPLIDGIEELPGRSNYFIGSDPKSWHTEIPNYARVRYQQVYPGVDMIFYGKQRQLEYDLQVQPGADPGKIRLAFEGVDDIDLAGAGDLRLKVGESEIRQLKPVIFQQDDTGERVYVAGGYVLNEDDTVSFEIAAYNVEKPLIIDPVLRYSTYVGQINESYGVAVDDRGNAYFCGITMDVYFNNGTDAWVAKLNSSGTAFVYTTTFGGGYTSEVAQGIAVDRDGGVYVTGWSNGDHPILSFPKVNPIQPAFGGMTDAFITKISPNGAELLFSSFLGGSGIEDGQDVAVDQTGRVVIAGQTQSADFPIAGAIQSALRGSTDAFITMLTPKGSEFVFSTYLGGNDLDWARDVSIGRDGTIYLTGTTHSADFPLAHAVQPSFGGGTCLIGGTPAPCSDAFVVALEPNGRNLIYSTYLGGSGADSGEGVAVDRAGNAFITGVTSSGDFPSMNPFQPLLAGGTDAFVTKIDPTGLRLMYSTYLGGTLPDVATAIAADERGQALITGWTDSADFPSHNPMQPFAGGGDAFVTRLNSAGAIIHSTFLGGSDFDYAYAIAAGPGAAYVTGITNSTNFPVTPGAPFSDGGIEPSPWGPQDGFAVKITDD